MVTPSSLAAPAKANPRREWTTMRLYQWLAPAIMAVLIIWLHDAEVVQRFENATIDARFRFRGNFDPAATQEVLWVGIDDRSLERFGRWPWWPSVHADFMELIHPENPMVVTYDILFVDDIIPDYLRYSPEASTLVRYNGDELKRLGDRAAELGVLVTGSAIEAKKTDRPKDAPPIPLETGYTAPIPSENITGDTSSLVQSPGALLPWKELRDVSLFGSVTMNPKNSDGIRRSIPMIVKYGDQFFPSLSLQTLCVRGGITADQIHVELGKAITLPDGKAEMRIPIDESANFLINYRNPAGFSNISYASLTAALKEERLARKQGKEPPYALGEPQNVQSRIVFIGQAANGLADMGPLPFDRNSPLALTHINALNNILKGDYISYTPFWPLFALWLVVTYGSVFGLERYSVGAYARIPMILVLGYVSIAMVFFIMESVVMPLLWPNIGYIALITGAVYLRWRQEQASRAELKRLFGSYVSPSVVKRLLERPDAVKLGGEKKAVTILFSDIRGYTSFSENLDGPETVEQLNEYFSEMVDCVIRNDGRMDKYIGDAIMAIWGDLDDLDASMHARRAVRCGLEMGKRLAILNERRVARGGPPIKIGIGLNYGVVAVGNLGAERKKDYTVIGDPVNVASRLEGVTKQFKTDMLVGESMRELLGDAFLVRSAGLIIVSGKTKPLRVYHVLADLETPGAYTAEELAALRAWSTRYETAFEHYRQRRFAEAMEAFQACQKERPGDYCTDLYVEQLRDFALHPPEGDWDGVIVMKSK